MGGKCQNPPGSLSMSTCHISAVYVLHVICVCMKMCFFQAKEAIKEAERCDPDNIFTQFSIYKIAVLENNVGKGIYKTLAVVVVLQFHYSHIF